MRSVDNLELVRWREMDSIHVLRLLADHVKEDTSFHPRASHQTTRWYQPGYQLSKAGVMLMDLTSDAGIQSELDFEATEMRDKSRLMSAVDTINARFGRGSIHVGSAVGVGACRDWSIKQERLTPQYITK